MPFVRDKSFLIVICLICFLTLSGCGSENTDGAISGGRDVMRLPGVNTAGQLKNEDEKEGVPAVITMVDTDKQIITLKVIDKRSVELKYSGATDIRNRSGEAITALQLEPGEVVYADYDAGLNNLNSLKVSSDEWKEEVSGVKTDTDGSYIEVGKEKYTYDKNLVVLSGTSKCNIEDIEPIDKVMIRGRDKKIDSLVITRGHGYLQLENTGFYEGGIIEVGSEVITGITADMRLQVPEGTFKLTVTKGKDSGFKEITIGRNEEISVNLAEFQDIGQRYGNIGFKIEPDDAALYIDKKLIEDYSGMVEVAYGEHQISVVCEGYKTYTAKINVDTLYQPLEIQLEKLEETTAKETETSTEQKTTKKEKETTTEETTTIDLSKVVSDILS